MVFLFFMQKLFSPEDPKNRRNALAFLEIFTWTKKILIINDNNEKLFLNWSVFMPHCSRV